MFEYALASRSTPESAVLLARVRAAGRAEARAAAERLGAVADLLVLRCRDSGERAEPRYIPSARLADFVRCRDLTCRAPGCDRPAVDCDIDHTIPYADGGPTHSSNLKCLCRQHHLLKTFWGWRDEQVGIDGAARFLGCCRATVRREYHRGEPVRL
ncbi:hypothetical protein A5711_10020 [Mycobacterium sp. E2238]|nr:hypothetical protein A5711_10020 [Mycobacterium sp. E2238]